MTGLLYAGWYTMGRPSSPGLFRSHAPEVSSSPSCADDDDVVNGTSPPDGWSEGRARAGVGAAAARGGCSIGRLSPTARRSSRDAHAAVSALISGWTCE